MVSITSPTPGSRSAGGFARRLRRRRGTSAVEYALLAGLVTCGLGVATLELGPPVYRIFALVEVALQYVRHPGGPDATPDPGAPPAGPVGGGPADGTNGGGSGGGNTTSL